MTWTPIQDRYDLLTDDARLIVNPRLADVGVVYTEQRGDGLWTYSAGYNHGRRWTSTEKGIKFEDISREEAVRKLLAYENAFRTPGLPKEAAGLVKRVLQTLKKENK